ncbi:MAG: hypothetical protein H0X24_12255 [Ktedonobacterales bacterium]|nr:hypothetical protein [Ktedonobacterales bacterium]
MSVYEVAARASAGLTQAQRDMLVQLVTVAPPTASIIEQPVAAADLRVITSLWARILDEMERLTAGNVTQAAMVPRLGALCMQSLHYVLCETGHPDDITRWVETVLLLLAEAKWLSTPTAERLHFREEGRS